MYSFNLTNTFNSFCCKNKQALKKGGFSCSIIFYLLCLDVSTIEDYKYLIFVSILLHIFQNILRKIMFVCSHRSEDYGGYTLGERNKKSANKLTKFKILF